MSKINLLLTCECFLLMVISLLVGACLGIVYMGGVI